MWYNVCFIKLLCFKNYSKPFKNIIFTFFSIFSKLQFTKPWSDKKIGFFHLYLNKENSESNRTEREREIEATRAVAVLRRKTQETTKQWDRTEIPDDLHPYRQNNKRKAEGHHHKTYLRKLWKDCYRTRKEQRFFLEKYFKSSKRKRRSK